MPFNTAPASLEDLKPDSSFDQDNDIVRVDFEDQFMYVNNFNGVWAVKANDTGMSISMYERFEKLKSQLPGSPGMRIDSAAVGSVALFSVANYDWRGIYRSEQLVSGLVQMKRADILQSTVVLHENR